MIQPQNDALWEQTKRAFDEIDAQREVIAGLRRDARALSEQNAALQEDRRLLLALLGHRVDIRQEDDPTDLRRDIHLSVSLSAGLLSSPSLSTETLTVEAVLHLLREATEIIVSGRFDDLPPIRYPRQAPAYCIACDKALEPLNASALPHQGGTP